ncbi:MAG: putative toxin-antitoxin system toxin component, PIN family, partial [Candidatus Rokubacteria bacterium]|nr:putative toxin-antitoxin system toxin component, PIN family [Candidatus Rokubacteria bacterium]
MIRVVADTNVYVSAILFGGNCEAILALGRAGVVDLFYSAAIRAELRSVLTDTFGWSTSQVQEALTEIAALATLIRPRVRLSGVLRYDPDHRILECALSADADFLVTGDEKHLQPL